MVTKSLCRFSQMDSLYVRCFERIWYERRFDGIIREFGGGSLSDWPSALTRELASPVLTIKLSSLLTGALGGVIWTSKAECTPMSEES